MRLLPKIFGSFLLLTSLLGCQPGAAGGASAPRSEEHALLGGPAPDFDLPRLGEAESGPRFRLSEQRGKLVVVDFWATWCKPCRESFPVYERMAQERAADTVFVGVSVDEEPGGIPAFLEETGATFPVTWDEGQSVSAAYQPPTMPTTFVVDRHGIVRFVHTGFRPGDETELGRVLDDLR